MVSVTRVSKATFYSILNFQQRGKFFVEVRTVSWKPRVVQFSGLGDPVSMLKKSMLAK